MKSWSSILNNDYFPRDNHRHNNNNNICGRHSTVCAVLVAPAISGRRRYAKRYRHRPVITTVAVVRCRSTAAGTDRGYWSRIRRMNSPLLVGQPTASIQRVASRGLNRQEQECWRTCTELLYWASCASSNLTSRQMRSYCRVLSPLYSIGNISKKRHYHGGI